MFGVLCTLLSNCAFGWDDFWLRTDQQAEKLFQAGAEKDAAQLFENPEWRGTAAYRTGDYKKAIEEFSRKDRPLTNFNRGNSSHNFYRRSAFPHTKSDANKCSRNGYHNKSQTVTSHPITKTK